MKITSRFATASDILAYYGEPLQYTLRAFMIFADDTPVAMIGLAKVTGARWFLVSEFRPEARDCLHRMPVLRAIKRMMQIAEEMGVEVLAVVDQDDPGSSRRILSRLGFVETAEDSEVWLWLR